LLKKQYNIIPFKECAIIKNYCALFIILLLVYAHPFKCQAKIDSAFKSISLLKDDTVKVLKLLQLSEKCYALPNEYANAILYNQKAIDIAKLNNKHWHAFSVNRMGQFFLNKSEYKKALNYFNQALKIYLEIDNKKGMSICYNNIGMTYYNLTDYENALENLYKAAKLKEELNDKKGFATSYISIGNVLQDNGNLNKALEIYHKVLKIRVELKDEAGQSSCYNNIGNIYYKKREYDTAFVYYSRSLELKEKLNDKNRLSNSYNGIGNLYYHKKNNEKALEYFYKAIKNDESIGSKNSLAASYMLIGTVYLDEKKNIEAKDVATKALNISFETQSKEDTKKSYLLMSLCDSAAGDYKNAYTNYQKHFIYDKLIFNENSNKKIAELETLYETEKKQQEIEVLNKNRTIQKAELEKQNILILKNKQAFELLSAENQLKELNLSKQKNELIQKNILAENQQKNIQLLNKDKALKEIEAHQKEGLLKQQKKVIYLIAAGSCLLLGLLLLAYKGYIDKKKRNNIILQQKTEVEYQKILIEEKQKEIIDSINYAKRLQDAILPPLKIVENKFSDSFVLYKPKDIVAGDFYWMESSSLMDPVKKTTSEYTFIAAADCTGHGVPGALVSVVCSNALNRSIKEFNLTETGKILDKTRELVLETFEKSSNEVKDGMDISLLCIDNTNKKVFWSGANNPLWYIEDNELKEIKANKQSIGKTDLPRPFTTHQINYKENSTFYLFTDGLADQFGGSKGKKFKYKQFAELLLQNKHLSQKNQAEIINNKFENWKGKLEQVDDVCVIGIKI